MYLRRLIWIDHLTLLTLGGKMLRKKNKEIIDMMHDIIWETRIKRD